ncbi:MAG: cyclic nucleotide-binding domain-containing protein, partial [Myxococcota bacterium]|nr:cyclic nucleotide-binding domain-containing protein [Myxococcota bacterium]
MDDAPTVANLAFVESLYDRYLADPEAVPADWRTYFEAHEEPGRAPTGPRFQARSIFAGGGGNGARAIPTPAPSPGPVPSVPAGPADPGRLALLRSMSLFEGLGPEALADISGRTVERRLEAGEALLRKGDAGDGAYFILAGTVRVERNGQLVASLGPGQVVGELSFLRSQVRSADVLADTALHLLHLGEQALDQILNTHAGVSRRLFEAVSERLRAANLLQQRVAQLVRLYRVRGHVIADLDPLGRRPVEHPELELAYHGIGEADLDVPVFAGDPQDPEVLPLRAVVERMRNTYCRHIGVQFMHIDDIHVKLWLQSR